MKKQVLIIIGAIVVLILILIWSYLLFVGTPKSTDEVFTELGMNGETETIIPPAEETKKNPTVDIASSKLRQLTTKPVIGFREVIDKDSTRPTLLYVEAGTGHIYSIDLQTGEERRVSGTTIPQAIKAKISPDGQHFAISSASNTKGKPLFVGTLNPTTDSLDEKLNENVSDFTFGDNNELMFSTNGTSGLEAYSYDIVKDIKKSIFSLPFHEAVIQWGNTATSTHYTYPKTSYLLEGFLFEIKNGKMNRLPFAGYGFSALVNDDMILYNAITKQKPTTFVYLKGTNETKPLKTVLITEKCTLPQKGFIFFCAHEPIDTPYEFPDEWYRGSLSFKDSIWILFADQFISGELINTFTESGREIDGINLTKEMENGAMYFTNKNDNTLWMYEL